MKVADFMTPRPTTVRGEAGLEEALLLMEDGDFRHLPVLEGEQLAGVVSERDVLEGLGWLRGQPPVDGDVLGPNRPREVRDIMHADVRVVTPADRLDTAAAVFLGLSIGSLPVVDGGRLVGIITEMDLLAAFVELRRTNRLPREADPPASEVMTAEVVSIDPADSLQDAWANCFAIGARHLPVVEQGRLVGIVSDRDLRSATNSAHSDALAVRDVMTIDVETIAPGAPLSDAARRMRECKITTLPVLDGERLAGILSLSDVMEHCTHVLAEG